MNAHLLLKGNYKAFRAARIFLSLFGFWKRLYEGHKLDDHWRGRISKVKQCPANNKIPRVENAGEIVRDKQIMHNGVEILIGSYYGKGNTLLLKENKGVHEPEEEFLFSEVLKHIESGGSMIELGAFWGFYSLWFNKSIEKAKNYLIEPDKHALLSGINNFKLNESKACFTNAYIGEESRLGEVPIKCVDDFCEENSINSLEILHSDIQGHELAMLRGAEKYLKEKKIRFLFISTHSNELHYQCVDFLRKHKYEVISSIDLDHTYAWDGLILASSSVQSELQNVSAAHGYLLS